MKSVWMLLAAAATFACGAEEWAKPDLVAKVERGELAAAEVSWWGFDAADSTRFIAAALKSKATKLTLDRQASPWYALPLSFRSNLEFVVPEGVELVAKRGAYRKSGDCLVTLPAVENVKLTGGGTLRMWFEDYTNKNLYGWSEWRHAVSILSSSKVTVENLRIVDSGGDGVYLGRRLTGVSNVDCVLRDLQLIRHNRQGISVITADRLLIERCTMADTCGTPPMAGIDFEPNGADEMLRDILVKDSVARGNYGSGFDFSVFQLAATSPDISITLENCLSEGNRNPLKFSHAADAINGFGGCVTIRNCTFNDLNPKLDTFKSTEAAETMALVFENSRAADPDKKGAWIDLAGYGWAKLKRPTWPDGTLIETVLPTVADFARAKIHDAAPGQSVKIAKPLKGRGRMDFLVYADQPRELRLTGRLLPVGKSPLKGCTIWISDLNGRSLARLTGPTEFRKSAPIVFKAPRAGFYLFRVEVRNHCLELLETDAPIAYANCGKAKFPGFDAGPGEGFIRIPQSCRRFILAAAGGGGTELQRVQLFNPAGEKVWDADNVGNTQLHFEMDAPAPGLWKLVSLRPTKGCMDDYTYAVYGLPYFLFLTPEKTWEL